MIFKIIILGGLVWLNTLIENPIFTAAIYAFVVLIFSFFFAQNIFQVLLSGLIAFLLASIYFWLLKRASGIVWWIILVGGVLVGLV